MKKQPVNQQTAFLCPKTEQMAAELGFEPRQTAPEAVVLPLHNSAMSFVMCRFLRTNEYYYTHVGVECQGKIQKNL